LTGIFPLFSCLFFLCASPTPFDMGHRASSFSLYRVGVLLKEGKIEVWSPLFFTSSWSVPQERRKIIILFFPFTDQRGMHTVFKKPLRDIGMLSKPAFLRLLASPSETSPKYRFARVRRPLTISWRIVSSFFPRESGSLFEEVFPHGAGEGSPGSFLSFSLNGKSSPVLFFPRRTSLEGKAALSFGQNEKQFFSPFFRDYFFFPSTGPPLFINHRTNFFARRRNSPFFFCAGMRRSPFPKILTGRMRPPDDPLTLSPDIGCTARLVEGRRFFL